MLFATHFMELVEVLDVYPNVVNLHLRVEHKTTSTGYKYLYKVEGGPNKEVGYGLNLARQMKFPESVMRPAQAVFDKLQEKQRQVRRAMHSVEDEKRKLHIQMLDQMEQGKKTIKDKENLGKFVKAVWASFQDKMQALSIS